MKDWRDIGYLRNGSEKQKRAYKVLMETSVLSLLEEYDPILVGTIPIEIDIDESDLDIVCCASDLNDFQRKVWDSFSSYQAFCDKMAPEVYIAGFRYDELEIELFTTNQPSVSQNGFRHMVVESRILELAGEEFKQEIIRLKKEGLKTEPAFGKLFGLSEPYSELLLLEKLSDDELKIFIQKHNKFLH